MNYVLIKPGMRGPVEHMHLWPACTCLLEIALVHALVCVPAPEVLITSSMIWHDMDHV